MRILGGEWKGRRLVRPDGMRPTADKVRKAVFDILGEIVVGARVLDLFAGSGALGLEALSRGAAQATFVESEFPCVRAIRENIRHLGETAVLRTDVLAGHATPMLRRLNRQGRTFDLILMDPPYGLTVGKKCLIHLDGYVIIKPRGWAVIEHALQDEMPEIVGHLIRRSQHRYGDTVLSLYGRTSVTTAPIQ